jgi:hypothetical protein
MPFRKDLLLMFFMVKPPFAFIAGNSIRPKGGVGSSLFSDFFDRCIDSSASLVTTGFVDADDRMPNLVPAKAKPVPFCIFQHGL